jgi:hypothetical protein
MKTEGKNLSSNSAVFSLRVLFLGCGFGLLLIWAGQVPKNGSWAWISPTMLLGGAVFLISNIVGLCAALAAVTKEEKPPVLGIVALLLNGIPIFGLLAVFAQMG